MNVGTLLEILELSRFQEECAGVIVTLPSAPR